MVDVELLRTNSALFQQSIAKRGIKKNLVADFLLLDKKWRELTKQCESLRSEVKRKSAKAQASNKSELISLKQRVNNLENELKKTAQERLSILEQIPNLICESAPLGKESNNKVLEIVGEPSKGKPIPHEEVMKKLGWLDIETAAQVSGSRFRYLTGKAARAHLALVKKAMDFAVNNGFIPVIPPCLAREEVFHKGGFFPSGKEDTYQLEKDKLFLSGTSELLLIALNQNQVFDKSKLPLRFVALSTCFRREAGTYGKDTSGAFRIHQFDKVELVSLTTPEESENELKNIVALQKKFVSQFDLPFRVVECASEELSVKEYHKYDLEVYFPSQERYRETHSASNCTDYQSIGFNIKYLDTSNSKKFVHCINGTLYTERLLLAIIENRYADEQSANLDDLV